MPVEFELTPGRKIGGSNPCFIVAEIGQNHQGDAKIAKKMIQVAKDCGVDCVKLQKSNLKEKFNEAALKRPYNSPHAWAETYGEHKQHLEISDGDFRDLKNYADELGIIFAASGMDETSVDFLDEIGVPFFKVGSGDANNFPYLIHTAKKRKPMIISSGMQSLDTMKQVYSLVKAINDRFCFLQCTSSYPTSAEDVHLHVIQTYQREFPDIPIGYSGHETGIYVSIAAVALGAKVVERHLTLDKTWKGSDHTSSLEPEELRALVREIRTIELALGSPEKMLLACELPVHDKLGKSVVTSRVIVKGERITQDMVRIKVAEPRGWRADKILELIGRMSARDMEQDESIQHQDVM